MLTLDPRESVRLRRFWRHHFEECSRLSHAYEAACNAFIESGGATRNPRPPAYPTFPNELRGLPCGARNRRGEPCKRTDLMLNGRCKFHGGMSTGPRSAAGQSRAVANLAKRWAPDRHEARDERRP